MIVKLRKRLQHTQRKQVSHLQITTVHHCIPRVTHITIKELQVTLTLVAGRVRDRL